MIKAEKIINTTLDGNILNIPRLNTACIKGWNIIDQNIENSSYEIVGAYLIANKLRTHFKKHIESFAGKTRFTSPDSIKKIEAILQKSVGYYIRQWENNKEKEGAIKAYNHIKKQIKKIIREQND